MADYPLTTVAGKIKSFLAKIREVGIPPKATNKWLKSIGFTSSNDTSLLTPLKYIGFIGSNSEPTELWTQFRGGNHKKVLAQAIMAGYSDLYAVYPDAHEKAIGDIENVISTSSTAGKQTITKTAKTFQNLCLEADFSNIGDPAVQPPVQNPSNGEAHTKQNSIPMAPIHPNSPSLHIDIQIHISPDSSPEQIDKIFESMAKHLYMHKE